MRLNLGCGDLRREGDDWINVDFRADVADVACDCANLAFVADSAADEVLALDLLEHFPAARTEAVLAEWCRVLRPGGTLTVKVPNLLRLSRAIVSYDGLGKQGAAGALIRNIYGGHRWGPDGAWDAHHTGWTPTLLAEALDKAGFDVAGCDDELNMTVTAVKR